MMLSDELMSVAPSSGMGCEHSVYLKPDASSLSAFHHGERYILG